MKVVVVQEKQLELTDEEARVIRVCLLAVASGKDRTGVGVDDRQKASDLYNNFLKAGVY